MILTCLLKTVSPFRVILHVLQGLYEPYAYLFFSLAGIFIFIVIISILFFVPAGVSMVYIQESIKDATISSFAALGIFVLVFSIVPVTVLRLQHAEVIDYNKTLPKEDFRKTKRHAFKSWTSYYSIVKRNLEGDPGCYCYEEFTDKELIELRKKCVKEFKSIWYQQRGENYDNLLAQYKEKRLQVIDKNRGEKKNPYRRKKPTKVVVLGKYEKVSDTGFTKHDYLMSKLINEHYLTNLFFGRFIKSLYMYGEGKLGKVPTFI